MSQSLIRDTRSTVGLLTGSLTVVPMSKRPMMTSNMIHRHRESNTQLNSLTGPCGICFIGKEGELHQVQQGFNSMTNLRNATHGPDGCGSKPAGDLSVPKTGTKKGRDKRVRCKLTDAPARKDQPPQIRWRVETWWWWCGSKDITQNRVQSKQFGSVDQNRRNLEQDARKLTEIGAGCRTRSNPACRKDNDLPVIRG